MTCRTRPPGGRRPAVTEVTAGRRVQSVDGCARRAPRSTLRETAGGGGLAMRCALRLRLRGRSYEGPRDGAPDSVCSSAGAPARTAVRRRRGRLRLWSPGCRVGRRRSLGTAGSGRGGRPRARSVASASARERLPSGEQPTTGRPRCGRPCRNQREGRPPGHRRDCRAARRLPAQPDCRSQRSQRSHRRQRTGRRQRPGRSAQV